MKRRSPFRYSVLYTWTSSDTRLTVTSMITDRPSIMVPTGNSWPPNWNQVTVFTIGSMA